MAKKNNPAVVTRTKDFNIHLHMNYPYNPHGKEKLVIKSTADLDEALNVNGQAIVYGNKQERLVAASNVRSLIRILQHHYMGTEHEFFNSGKEIAEDD